MSTTTKSVLTEYTHCWHSPTQHRITNHSCTYITKRGRKFICTDASGTNTKFKCWSLFPDMKYVGYGKFLSVNHKTDAFHSTSNLSEK